MSDTVKESLKVLPNSVRLSYIRTSLYLNVKKEEENNRILDFVSRVHSFWIYVARDASSILSLLLCLFHK